jgi:hypothetical protein
MIAMWGLPGTRQFEIARCASRAEGEAWFNELLAEYETQETLQARRQSRVLSEREARGLRWRDGARIVGEHVRTVEEARAEARARCAARDAEYAAIALEFEVLGRLETEADLRSSARRGRKLVLALLGAGREADARAVSAAYAAWLHTPDAAAEYDREIDQIIADGRA